MESLNRLVVAEKPSVAAGIADVLGAKQRGDGFFIGQGWIVTWCLGHLVELADAAAYGEGLARWNYADLPILPDKWRFTASEGKRKQLGVIKDLMNREEVEAIICATDSGREGELIFRLIYDYCGCVKPVQRLWIQSMEDSAIRAGFANLRPGADYDRLYRAALCRAQADWICGINATRLFSVLYGATLTVGRVQTPTLSLIVERERAVAGLKPEPFYTPMIDCGSFTADHEKLFGVKAAEEVRAACDGKPAILRKLARVTKTASPPALYDLTTLQREANRLLGYTAQQTLDYTQSLYEKKLCSYPRTDSRFLTSDMAAGLPSLVRSVSSALSFASGLEILINPAQVIDSDKISDHHAIIPTPGVAKINLEALPAGECNILKLITARLLCAVGDKHSFEAVTAVLECAGYSFAARGRKILRNGWKTIDKALRDSLKQKPDSEAEDEWDMLPELTEGQVFASVSTFVREGKTAPPKRFTEDTLLRAMDTATTGSADDFDETPNETSNEIKGLGTPATRAGIIERLIKTGLVERKKKQLTPTDKGVNLITVLPDIVKSPLLTAEWEHRLTQIERGELDGLVFMTDIAAMTLGLVKDHPAPNKEHAGLFAKPPDGGIVGHCPRCGGSVHENKRGFFCGSRACGFALWRDNRFFSAKRKALDKSVVNRLLNEGRVFFSDLYSERTGKSYAGTVIMDDDGKTVNYRLEFMERKPKQDTALV